MCCGDGCGCCDGDGEGGISGVTEYEETRNVVGTNSEKKITRNKIILILYFVSIASPQNKFDGENRFSYFL